LTNVDTRPIEIPVTFQDFVDYRNWRTTFQTRQTLFVRYLALH
jgi:hypothetical protein